MGTIHKISKLILAVLALSFYTGCGGGDDPASTETTTTINHNFLFFNSCVAPCPEYQLFKHSLDDNTTTVVGAGIIQAVEAEYDPEAVNIAHNGKYYFSASDGTNGYELWVYDPQISEQAGVNPKMVMDINPGSDASYPYGFVSLNDKIYFSADTPAEGEELWVYDPAVDISATNPKIVFDTRAGATGLNPSYIAVFNGKIYMRGQTATQGVELWVYDPAVAASATNPQVLADIRTGTSSGHPRHFIGANNKLYFRANDGTNGYEPWVYDPALPVSGTNPKIIYDVYAGSASSNFNNPIVVGDKIYYGGSNSTSGSELFVLDTTQPGSATNPQAVYEIQSGTTGSNPYYLKLHNNKIYFRATSPSSGTELYVFDLALAPGATNPNLLDINPGSGDSDVHYMTSIGDKLYFGVEAGPTQTFGVYDESAAFSPGVNPIAADAIDYVDWLYDMIPLTYTTTVTE